MKKLLISIFFLSLILSARNSFSQKAYDVEGRYSVGKTACTIEWSESSKAFRVYWDKGTGYTLLFYSDEYPNGNIIYTEYEDDGATYVGSFTFSDSGCNSGTYTRWDSKKFSVRKK
ncbi:MAG: hypothetical protein IT280_05470 [Ignavibacteria bacterium]|nr:hypothetical protein [Ignavibacteria bacterium]